MASLLANSERRLVVVLWGEKIEMTNYPGEGVIVQASGAQIPEGPGALLAAINDAMFWIVTSTPPRTPLDLGPIFTQTFRFIDDDLQQPSYYALHDGNLGMKESPNLANILQVSKDWLTNAGVEA